MDWITQAALGALIGELMLGRRLGKRALAWGALIGILPELDILIFPVLDTARQLAWHHGPSHALWIMALISYAIAHGLAKIWKKEQISKAHAGWFVFAVFCVHLLADCLTAEGVPVLWPISEKRIAFNLFYQSDLFFTCPLVASVLWLAFIKEEQPKKLQVKSKRDKKPASASKREKKPVPASNRDKIPSPATKRWKFCCWGLGISVGFALLAMGMNLIAWRGFDADLARRGTKFTRRLLVPTSYNCLLWRAVVDREGEFWVGYRSVFESRESPVRWTVYLKSPEALGKVREMRETKTLLAYTDGWWIARPNAKGVWLGDLRFPESRVWGSKKGMVDSRLTASWLINPTATRDHLQEFSPSENDRINYFQRMSERICGNRESWEANPRLAGVNGALPEFLSVEE